MDPHTALLVELLSTHVLQAPGSEASTRRALDLLAPLPASPCIADLGCGRGASALRLARATGGTVLALDLLPPMVEAARQRAEEAGLSERVQAVVGDMATPPVEPGSLDLIWCEGAAYSIGVERALQLWRPLLREGGGICISDLCWRSPDPPAEARAHWAHDYPDMAWSHQREQALVAAGYTPVGRFWSPESDQSAFYEPILANIPAFLAAHPHDELAASVAEEMRAEAAAWRQWGQHFGFFFMLGRASPPAAPGLPPRSER